MRPASHLDGPRRPIIIPVGGAALIAELDLPPGARSLVVFAHGSGSGRASPRNRYVAGVLQRARFGTLLVDLLTPDEQTIDEATAHLRFDISLLAQRLQGVTRWATDSGAPLALFGASTGAAAALIAAARQPDLVRAVVSRGGRPDLAADELPSVRAPTLLIVGGRDPAVLDLNRRALEALGGPRELEIVPGAGHLFAEPGALAEVARVTCDWFERYLP